MGEINSLIETETELEDAHVYEIFFSGGETSEDDGLVWKDILREGEWAYRPDPNGKPVPVPLKVIAGKASNSGKEIGMADLEESFNDQAIDHVTVPTSHEDKPHENTGYVRKVRKIERGGKKVFQVGIEFTEPEIKGKALRGTIANTSAGIIFDYVKKDSGKKYTQALGHVALTNKPWINGMKPFGMSEEFEDSEIIPVFLAQAVWNQQKSFNWIKDNIQNSLKTDEGSYIVADVMSNRALVAKFDNEGRNQDNYVIPFKVHDGSVDISPQESWIKASREWVKVKTVTTDNTNPIDFDSERLSEGAPNVHGAQVVPTLDNKEENVATKGEKTESASGAPSDGPAPEVGLSEEAQKVLDAQREEFEDKTSNLSEENKTLRREVREMRVDKRVEQLKKIGFEDHPGLLKEIRNIMLASDDKPAVLLSEQVDGEEKVISLSATDIVERIIKAMPYDDDGKVKLSEQALITDDHGRPETELSEDSAEAVAKRTEEVEKELGFSRKTGKDGDA